MLLEQGQGCQPLLNLLQPYEELIIWRRENSDFFTFNPLTFEEDSRVSWFPSTNGGM